MLQRLYLFYILSGTFTGTPTFTAPTSTAGVLETVAHSSRADLSTLKVRCCENYQVESLPPKKSFHLFSYSQKAKVFKTVTK